MGDFESILERIYYNLLKTFEITKMTWLHDMELSYGPDLPGTSCTFPYKQ